MRHHDGDITKDQLIEMFAIICIVFFVVEVFIK
jgi:hypothetical protein